MEEKKRLEGLKMKQLSLERNIKKIKEEKEELKSRKDFALNLKNEVFEAPRLAEEKMIDFKNKNRIEIQGKK